MNTIIKLRCLDQVLTFENTPLIASGGLEEDRLVVSFCSKWAGMTKTAVFWRTEDEAYHVVLDNDGGCTIPPEVLTEAGTFFFGLFGVRADGCRRTTQVVRYNIAKGAITAGTQPSDPTPEYWNQVLALCQEVVNQAEAAMQALNERQSAHEQTVNDKVAGIEKVVQDLAELGHVGTDQLKAGAVTASKIQDGAVTTQKLHTGLLGLLNSHMSKSGGSFTGRVAAAEGAQDPGQYSLRNSKLSTTEETPTVNGQICWRCK